MTAEARVASVFTRTSQQEVLRGAGTITPAGESPSILLGVGYSVVTLSVTGFFVGIIWARTKNLLVLMFIHAAGDLLTNFGGLVEAFNI